MYSSSHLHCKLQNTEYTPLNCFNQFITMPLASSICKDRLSLPATIDSTTKVTRPKAVKRRNSLRSKRDLSPAYGGKENDCGNQPPSETTMAVPTSPGPIPYHVVSISRRVANTFHFCMEHKLTDQLLCSQVAGERERDGDNPHSPRLTRSAAKKKSRPPLAQSNERRNSRGVVLSFSPPDQEANRRREAEDLARRKANFERRVQKARANGQLLEFSPTSGRPLQTFGDEQDRKIADSQDCSARKDDELVRLVGGQQAAIQNLEGQMNQFLIMQTKSFEECNKAEQLTGLQSKNVHLERSQCDSSKGTCKNRTRQQASPGPSWRNEGPTPCRHDKARV